MSAGYWSRKQWCVPFLGVPYPRGCECRRPVHHLFSPVPECKIQKYIIFFPLNHRTISLSSFRGRCLRALLQTATAGDVVRSARRHHALAGQPGKEDEAPGGALIYVDTMKKFLYIVNNMMRARMFFGFYYFYYFSSVHPGKTLL